MNFWHMQLHPNDISWNRESEVLRKTGYIGLGDWSEQLSQQSNFENRMSLGDIVAVKRGGTLIALTKVIGNYEYTDHVTDLDWFVRRRQVEILDWYHDEYNYYVFPRGTLTKCDMKNSDSITNQTIKKWYEKVMEKNKIAAVTELLAYKHQIILQGSPGTGKTRLAKLVAEKLTDGDSIVDTNLDSEKIIDELIRNSDLETPEAIKLRSDQQKALEEFQNLFPKEELKNLTLEQYAIGNGDKENFCWWIERGLQILGSYFPGSSLSYKVYWSSHKEQYSKHGFIADVEDTEQAMQMVAETLHALVNDGKIDQALERFGQSFVLKILNSYHPDEYFPINSERSINNALKLLNAYDSKLSLVEKNKKLNQIYLSKKEHFNSNIDKHEFSGILWQNFDLKEGNGLIQSETINNANKAQGEYEIIQFHPAYSYEDFVRGIVANTDSEGNIKYQVENKILAEFAQKAFENPDANYVLIIDEINRANLSAVLGELIYTLEYRDDNAIKSMYELDGNRNIVLPRNLYIIGTMNTADRSVGHIDYAVRRRFAFVDVLPDADVITNNRAKDLFNKVADLFSNDYLSPDFHKNDVQIGHSYFIVDSDSELSTRWNYEIKPILNEYIKDGVLSPEAQNFVDSLYV